jgi:reactive intermediate/imine deaminase
MERKEVCKKGFRSLPFSQVIRAGDFVFVSGQTVYNPDTKNVECRGIEKQTEAIIQSLKRMLKDCGGGLEDVVKTTVFLRNASDFEVMNAVYRKYFSGSPPTRTTVGVSLIADVDIEIEAIAHIPKSKKKGE